jgi:hypothetical protein
MDTITLYKYRAVNDWSLDTLRSGKMWFSLPTKLNDTFEFSLPVFVHLSPTELVEHFEKRFKIDYVAPTLLDAMMKHGGSKSFPATEQFIQNFLASANADRTLFVIALIHFLREQGLATQAIVERLNLGASNELRERLEGELREAYEQNQAIGRHCGVLSLSGRNDEPLMWAHYADSCKGMCIGVTLDVDELVKSDFIPLWVEYADELPVLGASAFFDRQHTNVMDMLKVFYATKYIAWKHEAEFRLVSKIGDLAFDLPGRITEVILGEKINDSDARSVLNAVQGRPGTKLLKMMREPGTWKYRAYGDSI